MTAPDRRSPDGVGRRPGPERDRTGRGGLDVRRRLDAGLAVLGRLVPLAQRVSRLVGAYVALVALASGTIIAVLLWRSWPDSSSDVVAHLVLGSILLAPVVVLWLFHQALSEVVALPARLAAVPDVARDHGSELARLVRDSQLRRGGLRFRSVPIDLWRAGRLLLAAHDDLPGYGAVLTLVSVPFLLATLASALVGLVLVVAAPVVLAGAVLVAAV